MSKMTDFQIAADYISRACPIGFPSAEERERCESLLDVLATDILSHESGFNPDSERPLFSKDEGPAGLAGLFARQQKRIEWLQLELASARLRADTAEMELAFAKTDALLNELGHKTEDQSPA